jgi:hypothetical protein
MSNKKNTSRKEQRQFLFVFNNLTHPLAADCATSKAVTTESHATLSEEQWLQHRERLIADLREFGC